MTPQTDLPSYRSLLGDAERLLEAAGVASARLDAEVMLACAMQRDRASLYANLGEPANEKVMRRFSNMIRLRQQRHPVAYLTGSKEFWSLPFLVTPDVLIPRPETEILVEAVCELLAGRRTPLVCDVGTGSGCIAVVLACEHPSLRVVATDVSTDALRVACHNVRRHGVQDRVQLLCSDLVEGLAPNVAFDLIVSNPPYVPIHAVLEEELSHEPAGALFAGEAGLDTIQRLLRCAASRLVDGGYVVMEFGDGQEVAVRQLAVAAGLKPIELRRDLAGIARALIARRTAGTRRDG